jgi:hypothetical protein
LWQDDPTTSNPPRSLVASAAETPSARRPFMLEPVRSPHASHGLTTDQRFGFWSSSNSAIGRWRLLLDDRIITRAAAVGARPLHRPLRSPARLCYPGQNAFLAGALTWSGPGRRLAAGGQPKRKVGMEGRTRDRIAKVGTVSAVRDCTNA